MTRHVMALSAALSALLLTAGGVFACNPVEGETVTLTKGVAGVIQASSDFESGDRIWLVNVQDGNSSNGCLIDDILVKSEPASCKAGRQFEVTGTLQVVPDLVVGGETYTIVTTELVCR